MKHAEVIFEPGSKSVVSYENEDELKSFVKEHHRRAVQGAVGGPTGHPAERITKVLLYDRHPAEYGVGGRVDANNINTLLSGMTQDGSLDANQLIEAVRDELSPVYPVDQGRHESQYKMQHTGELDLSFLNEGNPPPAQAGGQ